MQDCEVVLLMEVKTFYRGEVRKGIVKGVAKTTSKRRGVKHYWIEFPDLHSKFEMYGHAIKPASVLIMIRKRKERKSTKKVLQRMNQKELMAKTREIDTCMKRIKVLRTEVMPQLKLQLHDAEFNILSIVGGGGPGNLVWLRRKIMRGYSYEIKSQYLVPAFKKLVDVRRRLK